ncbi:MAG: transglutaminaseTgpA domain-containing protein [Opitutales bacterium]
MSTVHVQVNLKPNELLQLKHQAGTVLSLLSFWALASLDMQSFGLLLVASLLCLAVLFRPTWLGQIPKTVWRFVGPVLLVLVAVDFLLSLPDLIPPLIRMMIWLLLYRILAPRGQREDMQLILLCLFSVILSGVLTVSLLFAVQILLFTPLAMAQLLLICILDRGEASQKARPEWDGFRWGPLLRRLRAVLDFRVLFFGALLFGFVVLVSSLIFILMPRFNLDQSLPFLQMQTQAMTGFNENVKIGEVSEVVENRSVAVRLDVPSREAVDPDPYWRMLVLDAYTGEGFEMSEALRRQRRQKLVREREGDLAGAEKKGAVWTFYMEGGVSRFLPMPGRYGRMRFQEKQELSTYGATSVYALSRVTQSVFSYQVTDLQFDRRFPIEADTASELAELQLATDSGELAYPETTLQLAVSDADREALAELNDEIRQGRDLNASEFSQALTEYLWERFDYSLRPNGQIRPDSASDDPVVNWLLSGDRGHCELFASAFILLAREAGIPSRMVIGFAGGSWNAVEDYFVMRQSEAHAWVEVFDPETDSWLRVDPTPGGGVSDPNAEAGAGSRRTASDSGWAAWLDSLRIQWYRRIVNFEQEDQEAMASRLKGFFSGVSESFRERSKALGEALRSTVSSFFGRGMLPAVLALVAFASSGYLLWLLRRPVFSWLRRSARPSWRMQAERRKAGHYLRQFAKRGADASDRETLDALRAIRYGPERDVTEVTEVFTRASRLLRRSQGRGERS